MQSPDVMSAYVTILLFRRARPRRFADRKVLLSLKTARTCLCFPESWEPALPWCGTLERSAGGSLLGADSCHCRGDLVLAGSKTGIGKCQLQWHARDDLRSDHSYIRRPHTDFGLHTLRAA